MAGLVAGLLGLNLEQAGAVDDQAVDILVSAGAGTGKTRVLTARYLRMILEEGYRPGQVVAITFTNKAAAEMRARIRRELSELADRMPQAAVLTEEINWAPIQTIHGFCGQLLRDDPLLADVPPGFGILDEAEAGLLLVEAADTALIEALESETEQDGLRAALTAFGRANLIRHVLSLLQAMRKCGLAGAEIKTDMTHDSGSAAVRAALSAWWDELMAVPEQPPSAQGTLAALKDLRSLGEEYKNALSQNDWEDPIHREIYDLLGRLRAGDVKALGTQGRELYASLGEDRAAKLAQELLPALSLLAGSTEAKFTEAKRTRAVLDFADLELETRDLLRNNKARERIQRRYPVLLIDEFQDTNPLQWGIIDSLRLGPERCRIFAVGDHKQSIYRFRGADVRVMQNYRQALVSSGGATHSLQENYRSASALTALVNHVCGRLLGSDMIYEPLHPVRLDPEEKQRVEMMFIPEGGLNRQAEAEFIADHIRNMLTAGAEISDPETGMARAVRPADIALLFRAATDLRYYEKALREAGLPHRVVIGGGFYHRTEVSDLLVLLASVENSGDGLALAGVLRSPLFSVGDAGLYLTSRNGGLASGFAKADFSAPEYDLDGPKLRMARALLSSLRNRRHLLGLEGILAETIQATDYYGLQCAFYDYQQRLANLEKLRQVARAFTNMGRGEVGQFLAYLQKMDNLALREGEAAMAGDDAILLLTVHRAKGLEFPVIFLPDLGRRAGGHAADILLGENGLLGMRFSNGIWLTKTPAWLRIDAQDTIAETAEAKRLLYVAMTRARDHLVLVGSGQRNEQSWLSWLREILAGAQEPGYAGVKVLPYESGHTFKKQPITTLSSRYPEIRRGEAIGAPGEAAAATETAIACKTQTLAKSVQLTVSGALDLRRCPRQYYFRHLLRLPLRTLLDDREAESGPSLGSALHVMAAAVMANPGGKVPLPPSVFSADAQTELRRLLSCFMRSDSYRSASAAPLIWSEYDFALLLHDEIEGILHGAMDLVWLDPDGLAHVADLKTNRLASPGDFHPEEHVFQIQLYALALRGIFGRVSNMGRLEYLWSGRGADVPTDEPTLNQVRDELGAMFGLLSAGHDCLDGFPPRQGPHCRWCEYAGVFCAPGGAAISAGEGH